MIFRFPFRYEYGFSFEGGTIAKEDESTQIDKSAAHEMSLSEVKASLFQLILTAKSRKDCFALCDEIIRQLKELRELFKQETNIIRLLSSSIFLVYDQAIKPFGKE